MLINYKYILLICCFFYATFLQAQQRTDTLLVSLTEISDYAIKNHTSSQNAELTIAQSQAKVKEILAAGYPQISGTLNYTHNLQLPSQLVPGQLFGQPEVDFVKLTFGTKNNISTGLSVSQLIFSGAYFIGIDAAKIFVQLAEKQKEKNEKDIKNNVTLAYLACLVSNEEVALRQKNIEILQKNLYQATQYLNNGFAEELDLNRLKVSLANAQTQYENAKRQAEAAMYLLKFQAGLDLEKPLKLSDKLDAFVKEAQKLSITTPNPNNRIEMKQLDLQKTLNNYNIRQYKAQFLPTAAAFGTLNTNFQSNNINIFKADSWIWSSMIGIQVNIPIFDGFSKKYAIEQLKLNDLIIDNNKKLFEQAVNIEAKQTQIAFTNALQQVKDQNENLNLANKVFDTTRKKYQEGLGSSLEVTQAEGQLYETQSYYISALYQLVVAKANLDKVLGN